MNIDSKVIDGTTSQDPQTKAVIKVGLGDICRLLNCYL